MESQQELKALRIRLGDELDFHEKETQRIRKALEAIDEVERLLSQSPTQTTIPETNPYESMGPAELVLTIVNSSGRGWSLADIYETAKAGGKDMSAWKNPRNTIYVAAYRHAKQKRIQATKNPSTNAVMYKRLEKHE